VWKGGAVVHRSAVGWRDVYAGLPMTDDTIFRIASMTKPVVSAAVLMLCEEGRIALDDPVARWMPELARMRVLRDPEGPLDDSVPAARQITVLDLLTHRSGLGYAFTTAGPIAQAYHRELGEVPRIALAPDAWLARLGALPLVCRPGERMQYGHSHEVL